MVNKSNISRKEEKKSNNTFLLTYNQKETWRLNVVKINMFIEMKS